MTGHALDGLRIGLMVRADGLVEFERQVVESLVDVPGVTIALVIVDGRAPAQRSTRGKLTAALTGKVGLWRLFERRATLRSVAMRPAAPVAAVEQAPRLVCVPTMQGRFSEILTDDDVARVRAAELDVIIRFGFGILRGPILDSATFGVWSFHHLDPHLYRGTPPAIWELVRGDPTTGCMLQRLTDRLDGGIPLTIGWFPTIRYSWTKNLDQVLLGSAMWPATICRRLIHGAGDALDGAPLDTSAPIMRPPNNRTTVSAIVRMARHWLAHQWAISMRVDEWDVGVVPRPLETFVDQPHIDDVRWLGLATRSAYVADPFGVGTTSEGAILAERLPYTTGVGEIVAFDVIDGEVRPKPRAVTSEPGHLSYPFVLETEDGIRVVTERSSAGTLLVHELDRVGDPALVNPIELIDRPLVDASPVFWRGTWWMFCTDASVGSETHLFIYHADDLLGPWTPHVANPVKSDVRSSRPAGTPFVVDDVLWRPAQDCSTSYGGSVVLNRVDRLDELGFAETPSIRLRPNAARPDGVHTVSRFGSDTLVDGKQMRRSPRYLPGRVRHITSSLVARLKGNG